MVLESESNDDSDGVSLHVVYMLITFFFPLIILINNNSIIQNCEKIVLLCKCKDYLN